VRKVLELSQKKKEQKKSRGASGMAWHSFLFFILFDKELFSFFILFIKLSPVTCNL